MWTTTRLTCLLLADGLDGHCVQSQIIQIVQSVTLLSYHQLTNLKTLKTLMLNPCLCMQMVQGALDQHGSSIMQYMANAGVPVSNITLLNSSQATNESFNDQVAGLTAPAPSVQPSVAEQGGGGLSAGAIVGIAVGASAYAIIVAAGKCRRYLFCLLYIGTCTFAIIVAVGEHPIAEGHSGCLQEVCCQSC